MASVTATIQYIQDDGDRAAYHASVAGGAAATHDGHFDPRQVQINDAWGAVAGFDLDGAVQRGASLVLLSWHDQ